MSVKVVVLVLLVLPCIHFHICNSISVIIRAVKANALIYEIIVAEINVIKYLNAVIATLFIFSVR